MDILEVFLEVTSKPRPVAKQLRGTKSCYLLHLRSLLGAVLGLERPRFYIPSFPTLHMISLIRPWVNRDNH